MIDAPEIELPAPWTWAHLRGDWIAQHVEDGIGEYVMMFGNTVRIVRIDGSRHGMDAAQTSHEASLDLILAVAWANAPIELQAAYARTKPKGTGDTADGA